MMIAEKIGNVDSSQADQEPSRFPANPLPSQFRTKNSMTSSIHFISSPSHVNETMESSGRFVRVVRRARAAD